MPKYKNELEKIFKSMNKIKMDNQHYFLLIFYYIEVGMVLSNFSFFNRGIDDGN